MFLIEAEDPQEVVVVAVLGFSALAGEDSSEVVRH